MNFRILDKKQLLSDKIRITEPVIIFNSNQTTIAEHTVTANEVGRIDLIAEEYYQNIDDSELILKYNNISNPFSITEGDVLKIPDNQLALLKWNRVKSIGFEGVDELNVRDQFVNSKRLTERDAKRVAYLKRKAAQLQNGSSQILPPNLIKEDETNITIQNGTIDLNGTK